MIKNKHKVILYIVGIAAIISGAKAFPRATAHPLVPTQNISSEQPIGGSPKSDKTPGSPPASQQSHPTANHETKVAPTAFAARTTPGAAPVATAHTPKQGTINEYAYHALGATPNDMYYPNLWQLQKVNAPGAWNVTTGSAVIVADIDTGFALQHEDLKDSWYTNPGETGMTSTGSTCWTGTPQDKAANSCDDDSNGYKDDWRGWNFYGRYQATANPCAPDGLGTYTENNNPQAGQSGDDIYYQESVTCAGVSMGDPFAAISHGTSTAGLIGATSNNSVGIASLNWNTKIMPLQALGDDGSGWTSDIARAIRYAVDNGAQVINMSLGGPDLDSTLQNAIDYAYQHNVVVIAAAGNCGTGTESGCSPANPGQMMYPALYPHVISVGATTQSDTRATFSSYGRGLDVVAPGSGTLISTIIDTRSLPFNDTNAYSGSLAGTSFAAPIVTSVASLVRSQRPGTSVDDINALIIASARKPASMNGAVYSPQYGHGVVDASAVADIAQALQSQTAAPTYHQTGNYQAEHTFLAADTLSSGCTTENNSYCTIRWTEQSTGFERYLPYKRADATGQVGWQWNGAALNYGEWWGIAQSGNQFSTKDYLLFAK